MNFRWGVSGLDDRGGTQIPGFILRNYSKIGMSTREFELLIHLSSFKYDSPNGVSRPSIINLVQRMGYKDERSVSRLISGLERKGLLVVHRIRGSTSVYDFSPFTQKCLRLENPTPDKSAGGTPGKSVTPPPTNLPGVPPANLPGKDKEYKIKNKDKETTPPNHPLTTASSDASTGQVSDSQKTSMTDGADEKSDTVQAQSTTPPSSEPPPPVQEHDPLDPLTPIAALALLVYPGGKPTKKEWARLGALIHGKTNKKTGEKSVDGLIDRLADGLSLDAELVKKFHLWWYAFDWRGQKGQSPRTPEIIHEVWREFQAHLKRQPGWYLQIAAKTPDWHRALASDPQAFAMRYLQAERKSYAGKKRVGNPNVEYDLGFANTEVLRSTATPEEQAAIRKAAMKRQREKGTLA